MHSFIALAALTAILSVAGQPLERSHTPLMRRHGRSGLAQLRKRQNPTTTTQPTNLASNSATADEGCTLWITPGNDGASCLSIITYSPGLTLSDFMDLNPEINSDCSNLEGNLAYCIDTIDEHSPSSSSSGGKGNNALATPNPDIWACPSKAPKPPKITATNSVVGGATKSSNSMPTATGTSSSGGSSTAGLLEVDDSTCGNSDPTKSISSSGGPNGAASWLNCGISKSNPSAGWTPPSVNMSQIVYQKLDKNGVFAPCSSYFSLFEAAEAKYNIPAIFFASFAMQESSCNPSASGDDGGAFGLMQITADKCGNAPGGNCNDPTYNVDTGAAYFSSVLQSNGGNPFEAVGSYNGWYKGLSYSAATKDQCAGCCCECQQNLDYLSQFFNCWIQNKDGSNCALYDNLSMC